MPAPPRRQTLRATPRRSRRANRAARHSFGPCRRDRCAGGYDRAGEQGGKTHPGLRRQAPGQQRGLPPGRQAGPGPGDQDSADRPHSDTGRQRHRAYRRARGSPRACPGSGSGPGPGRAPGRAPGSADAVARAPTTAAAPAPGLAPAPATAPPPARAPTPGANVTTWRWPAAGSVTRGYSSSVHKGIDIGGDRGDPIYAVADGTVVYAGTGIVGFGELVIVKHNDIYISAYGHNERLLVKENDVVGAGQVIAEKGSSGTDSVKLHFEIRKEGKPVDPLKLLPRR